MSKSRLLCLCAAFLSVGFSTAASAAVKKAYMHVSVTVIASCTIMPGLAAAQHGSQPACARTSQDPGAILSLPPVVTMTTDPETGLVRETIEF